MYLAEVIVDLVINCELAEPSSKAGPKITRYALAAADAAVVVPYPLTAVKPVEAEAVTNITSPVEGTFIRSHLLRYKPSSVGTVNVVAADVADAEKVVHDGARSRYVFSIFL